jgi:hypothetical protein
MALGHRMPDGVTCHSRPRRISNPRPSDGSAYATALSRRLQAQGFEVFLDRANYATGDDWKQIGTWTLRRTSQLVLVGSPAALYSDPVIREIAIFSGTKRRIVPIDFGGSLEWQQSVSRLAKFLPPQILRIKEPTTALNSGPSDATVASIRQTFDLVRQDKKRLRVVTIALAVTLALAIAAGAFGYFAQQERVIADQKTIEAQSQRDDARRNQASALAALSNVALLADPTRAVKLALAAWPRRPEDRTPKLAVTMTALGATVVQLREREIFRGHEDGVSSAAFSPDGTPVVTASVDNTARLWDAATGKQIAVLRGHEDNVQSAVFSPDGTRVVTACADKTARLWDAATGALVAVLRGHEGGVSSAAFSPNRKRVVTSALDKSARLWSVETIPKGNIFQIACAWLPDHDLTDIARDYGLTNLEPICQGDPPPPDWPGP